MGSVWAAALGLLVVAVVAAVVLLGRPAPPAPLSQDDSPTLGRDDAPVTIYYFADFQCPACRRFETGGNFDQLERDHIDTGRVRLVFKQFPILGEDSWTAAEASLHVWRTTPAIYWEWHGGLFERQGSEGSGWASAGNILRYSGTFPQIDVRGLETALDAGTYLEAVERDKAEGAGVGVQGTPTVIVDGRLVNPLDRSALGAAIEASLAGTPDV